MTGSLASPRWATLKGQGPSIATRDQALAFAADTAGIDVSGEGHRDWRGRCIRCIVGLNNAADLAPVARLTTRILSLAPGSGLLSKRTTHLVVCGGGKPSKAKAAKAAAMGSVQVLSEDAFLDLLLS
jgi:hypothetical protein